MFNVDSHFVIGKNHIRQNKPCQDHTLYSLLGENAFAVISDGCSSGGHTDIGSRIITCAVAKTLKDASFINMDVNGIMNIVPRVIMNTIVEVQDSLSRHYTDLLATCIYSYMTPTGGLIHMFGDGCAAIKYIDGSILIIQLEWQNNMPFYPIYKTNNLVTFIEEHMRVENGEKSLKVTSRLISGTETTVTEEYIPVGKAINGYVINISEMDNISAVGIFSDGVEDFHGKESIIPCTDIIPELMAFKNFEGDFVKRRLSMALKNYAKAEIFPNDDVSAAATYFIHPKPTKNVL